MNVSKCVHINKKATTKNYSSVDVETRVHVLSACARALHGHDSGSRRSYTPVNTHDFMSVAVSLLEAAAGLEVGSDSLP